MYALTMNCGIYRPAGLIMASWASQYDIHARIVDEKSDGIQTGQADGLHSRTLEILHSFGIADRILREAQVINEICSWNPDPKDPSRIVRTERVKSQPNHLSIYQQISLHQGRIEQHMLSLLESKGRVTFERKTFPTWARIDENEETEYPVEVVLQHDAADDGSE